MITIGLIEDHDLYRKSLKLLLESFDKFHVIIDAENGDIFLNKLASSVALPDIVITDIHMPKLDGKAVVKLLMEHYPTVKTIVLTMYSHEHIVSEVLLAGAKGFLNKNINVQDLYTAINTVIAGNTVIVLDTDHVQVISEVPDYKSQFTKPPLSEKQKAFLRLCTNPRLTYKEIASILDISPKTADRYRDELFKKLDVNSRSGLILYASQVGITNA